MKKLYFISALLFLFSFSINAQQEKLEQLDEYIVEAMEDWELPGLAIAIVRDDSVIFSKGYGVRRLKTEEPVNDKSLFQIASCSKAFTTAALSILVDEGKLKWDDKVREYLPWFQMYNGYVSNEMTIRDLVTHRSGLATFSGDLIWFGSNYSAREVIERAKNLKPKYGFREKYGYQNIMFSAAGAVLEAVTGDTWQNFVKIHFFEPLRMMNSTTSIRDLTPGGNIAYPHQEIDGELVEIPYYPTDNVAPAAAICSNVSELANWIRLQLGRGTFEGTEIFSRKASREMWSNQMHNGENNYGLGWAITHKNGLKIVEHGGGMPGMISRVSLAPEKNFGFVILTNKITWLPSALRNYIYDLFFADEVTDYSKRYLGFFKKRQESIKAQDVKMDSMRVVDTKPSFPLEKYTGVYEDAMYGKAEVSLKDGRLHLQLLQSDNFRGDMTHWHFDVFKIKWYDEFLRPTRGFIRFEMNSLGEIYKMIIDTPHTPDFLFQELDFRKPGVREFID